MIYSVKKPPYVPAEVSEKHAQELTLNGLNEALANAEMGVVVVRTGVKTEKTYKKIRKHRFFYIFVWFL